MELKRMDLLAMPTLVNETRQEGFFRYQANCFGQALLSCLVSLNGVAVPKLPTGKGPRPVPFSRLCPAIHWGGFWLAHTELCQTPCRQNNHMHGHEHTFRPFL